MKEEQKIFTPREFIAAYQLPQLVCIHEAHLQQVNESRPRQIRQINRNRPTKENDHSATGNAKSSDKTSDKKHSDGRPAKSSSLLSSLTNTVQQLPKQYLKKGDQKSDLIRPPPPLPRSNTNANPPRPASRSNGHSQTPQNGASPTAKSNSDEDCKDDEVGDELFLDEPIADEENYRKRFHTSTLASSDSGNASADSGNASSNCSENQYPSNTSPVNSAKCEKCQSASRCEHRVEPPKGGNGRTPADDRSANKATTNNLSNLIKSSTLNGQKLIKSGRPGKPSKASSIAAEKKLLDLDQPFLLYKSYSSRQVIAHCLDVSSAAQQESLEHFQRTGPSLLIPESYSGI